MVYGKNGGRLAVLIGLSTLGFFCGGMRTVLADDTNAFLTLGRLGGLLQAAEGGETRAQCQLGYAYALGEGCAIDLTESAKWYRRAADQGQTNAQYNLGILYLQGKGVPQDCSKAAKWFRQAAERNDPDAQFQLGELYRTGRGMPQDFVQAYRWLNLAAAQTVSEPAEHDLFQLQSIFRLGSERVALINAKVIAQEESEHVPTPKGLLLVKCIEIGAKSVLFEVAGYQAPVRLALSDPDLSAPVLATRARAALQDVMTREQVAEAQRLSSEFANRQGSKEVESKRVSQSEGPRLRATGSGFFITESGCLLTCYHVVEGASEVSVRFGGKSVPAEVTRIDPAHDLALLKVPGRFRHLPVGSSGRVRLGEAVFTVGYPNISFQGVSPKLTRGNISSLCGMHDDPRHFQISVPVQKGSSGGPLVSESGFVVGVITAKLNAMVALKNSGDLPQNVNYALRSDCLRSFLSGLLPESNSNLMEPETEEPREFVDLVSAVADATVLVEVY